MDALCESPASAAAHSLMGDIYVDQGRLDDAIQWYCLAIDLDPEGTADRAKLTKAIEERKQQLSLASPPLDLDAIKRLFRADAGDPNRTRFWRSERPIRIAIFIAIVACLSAVVAWPLLSSKGPNSPGTSSPRRIDTNPIFLSPFTGSPSPTALSQASGQATSDPVDSTLRATLAGSEDLTSHAIAVTDVAHDPRAQRLTITFIATPVAGSPASRALIVRDALRVAQIAAASSPPPQPTAYTLRALVPSQAGGSPLSFIGDIAATDAMPVNAFDESRQALDIEAHFSSVWWGPSLPPDAPATPTPSLAGATSATSAPTATSPPGSPGPAFAAPGATPVLATPHAAPQPASR